MGFLIFLRIPTIRVLTVLNSVITELPVMLYLYLLLIQFMDRLKLLLMPAKHQPDLIYLRHVPLRKVHLFTFVQLLCLALLWILKSTVAAIIFPVMVRFIVFSLWLRYN